MRIGIDARLFNQTGVGRYIRNLISELSLLDRENEYLLYLRKEEFSQFDVPNKRWKKKRLDIPWHTLKEQLILPSILLKDNLDIAHFPYFNIPIFYPKKFLLTIHDLIVDHFDTGRASTLPGILYKMKRLGYKTSLNLGIRRAALITAISETTKEEILNHYPVKSDKIVITYDALDNKFKTRLKNQEKERYYTFPYILYVGNAYPHKNLERLIKAFSYLSKKYNDLKLVMAGDDKYFYPRLKRIADMNKLSDKIIFYGEANDIQLINLYSFSECLIFPSLMEGFGLPNLEAVACGKLPVVSNIPVFKEIWGNELPMFDPENADDMVQKIKFVLDMEKGEYKSKVKECQKIIENFSWRDTAQKTLEIYKQIYDSSIFTKK